MDIKIFLSYHKSTTRLKTNILTPIHVGRAIASKKTKEELSDIIGDDTGDNISNKNSNYCELTAQYWAWKNCNADYIGFMHYRRHLSFNIEKNYSENKWGVIDYDYINKYYLDSFGLNDESINKLITSNDVITVEEWNVNNAGSKNNYEHYKYSDKKLYIEDYDKALNILLTKYPEYETDIKNYNNSQTGYYTNIFVMKKNIFNEYCTLLFDVLFELENERDISSYNTEEARVFGYISEWLFGIYIYHLKRTTKPNIKTLQRTFVYNTDIVQNNDAINICFSSDDNYIQHCACAIASILKNTKTKKDIDIYILHSDIKKYNIEKINKLRKINKYIYANFYFINIDNEKFSNIHLRDQFHVTLATYYRYMLPSIFNNLKKILYIDCDILAVNDIEELYNINIDNYYIAAVQDIIGFENQARLEINISKKYYYCNAGVMLVNLEEFRQDNIEKKLFDFTYEKMSSLLYLDQDVINVVCEDKIKYIDLSYNLQTYPNAKVDYNKDEYEKAIKNPKIIHFIGEEKPWHIDSKRIFRNLYFKYLRLTAWKNYYRHIFFAEIVFSKYDKGIYRKYKLLGITITTKPISLQIDHLNDRLNYLEKLNTDCKVEVISKLEKLNTNCKVEVISKLEEVNSKVEMNIKYNNIELIEYMKHNNSEVMQHVFQINKTNDDILSYEFSISNKIKENNLRDKIKNSGKIKVFFTVNYTSKFGLNSVYEEMLKYEIFEPYILVAHARDNLFDKESLYFNEVLDSYNLYKELGYNVILAYDEKTKKLKNFDELSPDIVFFTNPNMHEFSLIGNLFINQKYLSCYVNYGINVVNSHNPNYHYKNKYINTAWKNFCETYFTYKNNMQINNGINAVLTGYPKLDQYAKDIKDSTIPNKIDNCKKIIIYAPHWSIKVSDNLSTFHLYYKYFINLAKNNQNINFILKPHPDLVYRLIDSGVMSLEEYNNYIKEWDMLDNGLYINEGEYIDLFRKSACLITDCGSFIAEYLPSKNPCIYLINPENEKPLDVIFNEFAKKILDSYYLCYNGDDITNYFNSVIINEDDPKKEERLEILKTDFINIGSAGKAIVDNIKSSLDIQ